MIRSGIGRCSLSHKQPCFVKVNRKQVAFGIHYKSEEVPLILHKTFGERIIFVGTTPKPDLPVVLNINLFAFAAKIDVHIEGPIKAHIECLNPRNHGKLCCFFSEIHTPHSALSGSIVVKLHQFVACNVGIVNNTCPGIENTIGHRNVRTREGNIGTFERKNRSIKYRPIA